MNIGLRKKADGALLHLGEKGLLRFVSIRPDWVDIRVTESCNSRCMTCYAWKNKAENELTSEEIKEALHQFVDVGVKNVVFIGGEPLLRDDIGTLVREASLLGFRNIIVVTNGLLLKNKAKELLENGVTHITVSIDGVGSTNDKIRGISGGYDRSIEGIEMVQKLKNEMNVDISVTIITTLLLNQNVEEIPKLIGLSKSLGVNWSFNLLDPNLNIFKGIPFSTLLVKSERLIDETIDYLKKTRKSDPQVISSCNHGLEFARHYLKQKNPYDFHCVHGYRMLYLGSHGEVYLGCYALDPIGNVRENKLMDVLGSQQAKEFAKKMYMMECPGCTNRYETNLAYKHLISHRFRCKKERKKSR